MDWRIAVDVGGTFTDLVCHAGAGRLIEGKVPSTPDASERGVLDAVSQFVPPHVVAGAGYFLHSATIGLNALLERKGAKVGLLCTSGLRDVLEIRRGDRSEMFNLFWRPPEPLVPRHLRLGVAERMRADGSVHRPLDVESVRDALAAFEAAGVDSIAVCLINAWANPEHEVRVMELIGESGFAGEISLSHRISGEYREYERTSTTVIDAYVRRSTTAYLGRLEQGLAERGFRGQCLIVRSGGGAITFKEAGERPFETIMSGPVAGAMGAATLARALELDTVVTADVGGTSFDTTLVSAGAPTILYEGEIAGFPVQTPWVDVRSIGAGGGSLARVDSGGLLTVGPESAGAVPGPAAYARGGTEPTITDAAVHLGMMGRSALPSGIALDVGRAETALDSVAAKLGKSADEAAVGILRIAAAGMANAIREITVERGIDPREATLLPFGGAGPLLAVLLADELDMDRIVMPPIAGNFSAWGLLGADLERTAARTILASADSGGVVLASEVVASLHDELDARGRWPDALPGALLDLRYQGQEHWISLKVETRGRTLAATPSGIVQAYEEEYRRRYDSTLNRPVEIVSVRAVQTVSLPRVSSQNDGASAIEAEQLESATTVAYSFTRGRRCSFAVLDRNVLNGWINGPAIVIEPTTCLYLDDGWRVETGVGGELQIARRTGAL